ncbi:M1 family metallopeptidase [Variovorax boronicumulans]|uniref:M1 family metallopeptidase n=1 Tax=Variovorax boronicumulans TaxID=436515 RepID=UPI0012E4052C|nr:M1 family metallopeptidase [Variovorax boronicumulans]GER16888.1 peptidase M1 [Variovorax boronicumulans]
MKSLNTPVVHCLALTAVTLAALTACGGGGDSGGGASFGGSGLNAPSLANAPAADSGDTTKKTPDDGVPAAPESAVAAVDRSARPMELPDTVWPVNYKLWFRPDAALKTFVGRADVEIDVLKPVDAIVVAAHDLNFARGRTTLRKVSKPGEAIPLIPTPQTRGDFVQLRLNDGQIAKGKYLLHMEWDGKIQFSDAEYCTPDVMAKNPLCSAASGIFKVGLSTPEGVSSDAIVTQGETNFARQWFPGWDEPAFRHTFEISAEVPGDWKTVSNGAQTEAVKLPDGYQRVAFEKTPSMPMYLAFFGGGKFDILADTFKNPLDGSDMALRWFTPPGRSDWAKFAMEWTKVSMDYYYKYTGISLPFKKFDTVAANDSYDNKPNTGFGGMENWGAIFEFADAVLTKPGDKPTLYSVTVVTHEVAHQWFGDLVTLDWWDNVWLNESFARWFERRTTIKFHPEYYSFSDYVLDKHNVIVADLKPSAVPVQRNLNDAGSFGFISPAIFVYNKGSHVLEMVQNYIGEEAMQKGLQIYLKDYAFGNVTPTRLWTSLEKAAGGKKVSEIGDSFIRQTGIPLLTVDAQCAGDRTYVNITQESFPNQNQFPASTWTIPVTLAYGDAMEKRETFVMSNNATQVELPGCTAVLAGPTGQDYYVSNYSAPSWSNLLAKVQNFAGNKPLLLNIERDAFRLLGVGRITQAQYDQIKGVLNLPAPLLAKTQLSQQKMAAVEAGGKEEYPHALRFQGKLPLRENQKR